MPGVGLPGRLKPGAGTHLASWLQEVTGAAVPAEQVLRDFARFAGRASSIIDHIKLLWLCG